MEDYPPTVTPTVAPDGAPCWAGTWSAVEPLVDVWAQAALLRTVAALPRLHPWRLGDTKGSSRQLQWVARPADDAEGRAREQSPLAVLAVTAREPDLDRSDEPEPTSSVGAALTAMVFGGLSAPVDGLRADVGGRADAPRWAGAMVRLPGTWLPPVAWLPRALRDVDDPASSWPTESVDFDTRYSVHAEDLRTAAALLTPAVMAIALDDVPPLSAVTLAGDALHVWWPYRGDALRHVGRVARSGAAARRLADALPHFVLAQNPDRSGEVEQRLAERRAAAETYRAGRRPGASADPVLQRIYEQARADLA